MRRISSILLVFVMVLSLPGCAMVTALRQPGRKNLQVLNQGTARENVIAYLGAPASTETQGEDTVDVYTYRQGYSGANKATRATMHITFDLLTIFIWEIIGWPAEMIFNGNDETVKVTYDKDKRIKDVVFLKRAD